VAAAVTLDEEAAVVAAAVVLDEEVEKEAENALAAAAVTLEEEAAVRETPPFLQTARVRPRKVPPRSATGLASVPFQ
jgi:hypothetical protein